MGTLKPSAILLSNAMVKRKRAVSFIYKNATLRHVYCLRLCDHSAYFTGSHSILFQCKFWFLFRKSAGLCEELISDLDRVRRRVTFPEEASKEVKHEETLQTDSDEDELSDETEDELESGSDSYIDSDSGSGSHDVIDVKRKSRTSGIRYSVQKAEDCKSDKTEVNSESESKKRKVKSAVADAEHRLLYAMDGNVNNSGNEEDECEEYGSAHDDESSDEVPTKKVKFTVDVKESQSAR
jgi:hypothetical protein